MRNIFSIFKKYVNKNIIIQCIKYYEDNDIFLKKDDNYIACKEELINQKKISFEDMKEFFCNTRGSNFSFFQKYNPIFYKAFHTKNNKFDINYSFPFENVLCIKPNFQDISQKEKLIKLLNKNVDIKYLIIDLRGSHGGSIKTCASICNLLLPECDIFTQKFKNKIVTYTSDKNYYKFKKIFIFVDKQTASSSEILAYSLYTNLKDSVLIGTKTYGKTCGQNIITNKKYGFIFSTVTFLWQIKNFSYENVKIIEPQNNDYLAEVQEQINMV